MANLPTVDEELKDINISKKRRMLLSKALVAAANLAKMCADNNIGELTSGVPGRAVMAVPMPKE